MPGGIRLSWGHLTLICLAAVVFFIAYWNFIPHSDDVNLDKKDGKGENIAISKWLSKDYEDKIDAFGVYRPFYGYTIVCPVAYDSSIREIQTFIQTSTALSKYFSPLPASSYRVTMFDIFSQRNIPYRYYTPSGAVPSYQWPAAYENLKMDLSEAQRHCDQLEGGIVFKPWKLNIGKVGLGIHGALSNMTEVKKLQSACSSVFHKDASSGAFHIALGYKFREINEYHMDTIQSELEDLWRLVANEYVLQKPAVYYFESMVNFVPFNTLTM